jgi:hypothetical protein
MNDDEEYSPTNDYRDNDDVFLDCLIKKILPMMERQYHYSVSEFVDEYVDSDDNYVKVFEIPLHNHHHHHHYYS